MSDQKCVFCGVVVIYGGPTMPAAEGICPECDRWCEDTKRLMRTYIPRQDGGSNEAK